MIATTLQQQFEARFSAHRADAAVLHTIEQELQRLNDPWAGKLRLRVIHARIQLRYGRPKLPTPGWCGQFGLQPPDGRPLYRYRLEQAKFERIQSYLKQQARPNGYARPGDQALFVLWAAEWFRRVHQGGIRKWEDVGKTLALSLSQATWRDLADAGLKQWKLRPLRLHGSTQRLLSLSRQGGFPLAAVEGDGNAWAARYLKRLVSILLGQPNITTEIAFEHARSLAAEVKESWQHDEFYVVSADLAQSIIALRREAEHAGLPAGLPPSVWLDQCRPEWRDELPLTIDSDAGRKLIDGLLSAEASRARSITVRATRLLRASGGTWHPWVRMDLNGSLPVADANRLAATWSRLRLFASGKLARYLPDELAIVEPADEGIWFATPRRTSTEAPVPFDVPIEAELRGGGERIGLAFVLKDGEPVHRPLLVCRAAGHEGAEDAEDILKPEPRRAASNAIFTDHGKLVSYVTPTGC